MLFSVSTFNAKQKSSQLDIFFFHWMRLCNLNIKTLSWPSLVEKSKIMFTFRCNIKFIRSSLFIKVAVKTVFRSRGNFVCSLALSLSRICLFLYLSTSYRLSLNFVFLFLFPFFIQFISNFLFYLPNFLNF